MSATLESIQTQIRHLEQGKSTSRAWDIALKALIPVVIAVTGWIVAIEVRVSVIESSRFTHRDGEALRMAIAEQMAKGYPPVWLKDSLNEIKARLGKLEDRMNGK